MSPSQTPKSDLQANDDAPVQSGWKPLFYIFVVPIALIALLQATGLSGALNHLFSGH
jgi:hypothetical protein